MLYCYQILQFLVIIYVIVAPALVFVFSLLVQLLNAGTCRKRTAVSLKFVQISFDPDDNAVLLDYVIVRLGFDMG